MTMSNRIFAQLPVFSANNWLVQEETESIWREIENAIDPDRVVWHIGWGTKSLAPEQLKANALAKMKKQFFEHFFAPKMMAQAGIKNYLTFGGSPIDAPEIRQRICLFTELIPKTKLPSVKFFTPDPAIHHANNAIAWLPGFAHETAKPMSWVERDSVKKEIAFKKEYFFTIIDGHTKENLVQLLKAFSIFKERQHTNMVWLFTGQPKELEAFKQLIATYKYKDSVICLPYIGRISAVKWMAGAYAFIYFATVKSWHLPIYDAMACSIPLIIPAHFSAIPGKEASILATCDAGPISDGLKHLFKDEGLRKDMIEEGSRRIEQYNARNTALIIEQILFP